MASQKSILHPSFLFRPFHFLLFFTPFFISCGDTQDQGHPGLQIERKNAFRPELSENTYQIRDPCFFQDDDGRNYLINNNFSLYDTVNQLEVYLLGKDKLVQRIELMPRDMGYLTKIGDYLYLDHDSILFSVSSKKDHWVKRFILIDSSEKTLQEWTVDGSQNYRPSFQVGGHLLSPLHYRNKTLFSPYYVSKEGDEGSKFNTPCMARIILSENEEPRVEPFGRYPGAYRKADRKYLPDRSLRDFMTYPLELFDAAMGKREIVLSFPASDTLYRYDLKGRSIGKRTCKSRYASPQDLWDELRKKGEGIQKSYGPRFKGLPHYTSLVHDPYRDLYYRVVYLGKKGWSLMVLSSELKLLGEKRIGEGISLYPPTPMEDQVLFRKNKKKGLIYIPFKIQTKKPNSS
ncbi:MAG: DUF4221 family protein [Flavobacteriales bacterium]